MRLAAQQRGKALLADVGGPQPTASPPLVLFDGDSSNQVSPRHSVRRSGTHLPIISNWLAD